MNNLENEISNCLNNSASKIHASLDLKGRIFSKLKDCKKSEHQSLARKEHKHSYKRLIIDIAEVAVFAFILFAIPTYITYHKSAINKKQAISSLSQPGENASSQNNNNTIKTADGKSSIQSSEIKKNNLQGHILVFPNPQKVVLGYNTTNLQDFLTTSEIAKKNNALCAINAGFFKAPQPGEDINSPKVPTGTILHEGKIIYTDKTDSEKEAMVGFNNNGLLIVGSYSINEMKNMHIKEAISHTIALIANGKPINSSDGVGPRTAIGQKADGSVIFLTMDGRIALDCPGASIKEVSDILLDAGAVNAALLDGGSSTTMVLKGKIINHPCDNNTERKVPSAFVVLP